MDTVEKWVERVISLLREGAHRMPDVLRLVEQAASEAQVEGLDAVLTRLGWYSRVGPELRSKVRARLAAFRPEVDDAADPSP